MTLQVIVFADPNHEDAEAAVLQCCARMIEWSTHIRSALGSDVTNSTVISVLHRGNLRFRLDCMSDYSRGRVKAHVAGGAISTLYRLAMCAKGGRITVPGSMRAFVQMSEYSHLMEDIPGASYTSAYNKGVLHVLDRLQIYASVHGHHAMYMKA
jgi:hypothetical protein